MTAQSIDVTPTAQFIANTNQFDIKICYRAAGEYGYSAERHEVHRPLAAYLVVSSAPQLLGEVFVSVKQPEDLALGNLMVRMAERAGFKAFLKAAVPTPGADLWLVIAAALKRSHTVITIWTSDTDWGTGVQREVELCRDASLRNILLLEEGHAVPELYDRSQHEFVRFHRENAAPTFDQVLTSLRRSLV